MLEALAGWRFGDWRWGGGFGVFDGEGVCRDVAAGEEAEGTRTL